eukprot:c16979_g1_i3.p1 GENE.c16979_g1_i3~~c16979_g1_i3.p1  ORF type:complete len:237 (+),score=49.12 c16979_g1_i3:370-1080(+)
MESNPNHQYNSLINFREWGDSLLFWAFFERLNYAFNKKFVACLEAFTTLAQNGQDGIVNDGAVHLADHMFEDFGNRTFVLLNNFTQGHWALTTFSLNLNGANRLFCDASFRDSSSSTNGSVRARQQLEFFLHNIVRYAKVIRPSRRDKNPALQTLMTQIASPEEFEVRWDIVPSPQQMDGPNCLFFALANLEVIAISKTDSSHSYDDFYPFPTDAPFWENYRRRVATILCSDRNFP